MSQQWRESPYTRHQEEKLAMLVKDFFYFDSLTPDESKKALETFRQCIHLLGFDNWHRIPVVSYGKTTQLIVDYIGIFYEKGVRNATQYIRLRGIHRISFRL